MALATVAGPAELVITWDRALEDREEHESQLRGAVSEAYAAVVKALPFARGQTLAVHVHAAEAYESRFAYGLADLGACFAGGKLNLNGAVPFDRAMRALLRHELVPVVLDTRGRGASLPAWLVAGIAEVVRADYLGIKGFDAEQREQLVRAARGNRLVPLPTAPPTSDFARLQSYAAARFVYAMGADKLGVVLTAMLQAEPPLPAGAALEKAFELAPRDFERAFVDWVERQGR